MAIKFQIFNEQERLLRAYSDNNKYLNEYDKNGNLLVEDKYFEAVHKGTYIDEDNGIFDNGKFYLESEKDIPIVEEKKETEPIVESESNE